MLGLKYKPYSSLSNPWCHPSERTREAEENRVDSLLRASLENRTLSMMEVHPDLIRHKREYRERCLKLYMQLIQASPEAIAQMNEGAANAWPLGRR